MKLNKLSKDSCIELASHYVDKLNKNHYQGPFCRIYLCKGYNTDGKGYCQEHTSPLRSGLTPGSIGSAPIVKKTV
jgi:hypothetical protein